MILFYVFLLAIPGMMLYCGIQWRRKPPKYPKNPDGVFNSIFFIDYRTEWALKSVETWNYSHICYGRMMLPLGTIALAITIVSLVLLPMRPGAIVAVVVDIICMSIPYFSIEKKLKQNFDKKGRWKEDMM